MARGEQPATLVVERRRHLEHGGAEGVAVGVSGLDGEARLRRPERQRVAVPRDACSEQRVLERVLPLGELAVDDPLLTGEAETRDLLAPGFFTGRLGSGERLELLTCEEVGVTRHDRGLVGRLLLADAHRPRLLRPLLEVAVQPALVRPRVERHAPTSAPCRSRASDVSRPRSSSDS